MKDNDGKGSAIAARIVHVMDNMKPRPSARQLSRMLGLSDNTIGSLLFALRKNSGQMPSGRTIEALMLVTGVSANWLLTGEGEMYYERVSGVVDPQYPNRGLAIELARSEGLLESAIRTVTQKAPERDLKSMDWFKLILRYHEATLSGEVGDAPFKWSADADTLITRCDAPGMLTAKWVGKRWDKIAEGDLQALNAAFKNGQRFSDITLNVGGHMHRVSGWPRYSDRGELIGFDGEGVRVKEKTENGNR